MAASCYYVLAGLDIFPQGDSWVFYLAAESGSDVGRAWLRVDGCTYQHLQNVDKYINMGFKASEMGDLFRKVAKLI